MKALSQADGTDFGVPVEDGLHAPWEIADRCPTEHFQGLTKNTCKPTKVDIRVVGPREMAAKFDGAPRPTSLVPLQVPIEGIKFRTIQQRESKDGNPQRGIRLDGAFAPRIALGSPVQNGGLDGSEREARLGHGARHLCLWRACGLPSGALSIFGPNSQQT